MRNVRETHQSHLPVKARWVRQARSYKSCTVSSLSRYGPQALPCIGCEVKCDRERRVQLTLGTTIQDLALQPDAHKALNKCPFQYQPPTHHQHCGSGMPCVQISTRDQPGLHHCLRDLHMGLQPAPRVQALHESPFQHQPPHSAWSKHDANLASITVSVIWACSRAPRAQALHESPFQALHESPGMACVEIFLLRGASEKPTWPPSSSP